MWLHGVVLGFLLTSAPADPPSKLLEEYLSIRTDHPTYGTKDAAKFWTREAEYLGIQSATWTIDPTEKCTHFMAFLPATVSDEVAGPPILLVHHADTMPADETKWAHPPFTPTWVRGTTDWELYGRGSIDDKGHGVVHWMALRNLFELPKRTRDVYFIMNCGEEISDHNGADAFVNFFIHKLPGYEFELSTLAKLETARLIERFPTLPKASWIWNEGSFGETTSVQPYTLIPIATAQKGLWLSQIRIQGKAGHSALQSKISPLEALVRGMKKFYDENRSWWQKFHSLHTEMVQFVSAIADTRPFWQKYLLKLYPRLFFEMLGLQSMVTSWWTPSLPQTTALLPNMVASEASAELEYRYLGDQTKQDIDDEVVSIFSKYLGSDLELKVINKDYVPFRRDFFEGPEAKAFEEVLKSYPKTIVSPFLTPGITDSRFFRMVGVRAFDFVPFFLTRDEIQGMHGVNERLPHDELMRGVEIETKILQKLVE